MTKDKILLLARYLNIDVDQSRARLQLLADTQSAVSIAKVSPETLANHLARALYLPEIKDHIPNLPPKLQEKLKAIEEKFLD